MMPDCYCTRCHSRLYVVAVLADLAVAFLCGNCESIWQINGVGWNRWLNRFDQELITPRYA